MVETCEIFWHLLNKAKDEEIAKLTELVGSSVASTSSVVTAAVGERVGAGV